MKRIMLAAMTSGSGKTTMMCTLLAALKRRGMDLCAFKCGPDYIDPMFHTRVLGVPSRNLDLFLQGEQGVQETLARHPAELQVLEGAMGFYDGQGQTDFASAWHVADATDTPVILVIRPKGISLTLAAQVKGMLAFRENSHIAGVLFADCKPSLAAHLTPILERETGLPVIGYLPPMEEAVLGSRHLGLITAGEIEDLSQRFAKLAQQLEQSADLDRLLALAKEVPAAEPVTEGEPRCRIAVAMDEAFCFYYADNLDLLRQAGAELVYFSPLRDEALPENVGGLYLGGGYPEVHAGALSKNESMRMSIRAALAGGLPTVAECGGFMYLQEEMEDADGVSWPMVGALPGRSYKTDRLNRFGYAVMRAETVSLLFRAGEDIPIHEFHYWDTTENGSDLAVLKSNGRNWRACVTGPVLYAGFPHLHFGGDIPMAERFAQSAAAYAERR